MNNYRLVYSTDPKLNKKCPKCSELLASCNCADESKLPERISTRLQIEKAKRGGKTVTVLKELPKVNEFLKSLCKELKNSCGTGGTFGISDVEGYIEIQGDFREKIRDILKKKNYLVKG
jgi:translation initiation factor 1